MGKGYCCRSGSLIEVEYDREDYYLMGYEDIPMEGLSVRVR